MRFIPPSPNPSTPPTGVPPASSADNGLRPWWTNSVDQEIATGWILIHARSLVRAAGDDIPAEVLIYLFMQEGGYWRYGAPGANVDLLTNNLPDLPGPIRPRESFGPMSLRNDFELREDDFLLLARDLDSALFLAAEKLRGRQEYITATSEAESIRQLFLSYAVGDPENLEALATVGWDLDLAVEAGANSQTIETLERRDANLKYWISTIGR